MTIDGPSFPIPAAFPVELAAPGTAEIGRRFVSLFEGRLADAGVEIRFDTEAETQAVLDLEPGTTGTARHGEHVAGVVMRRQLCPRPFRASS